MKPFDDALPEERESHQQELLPLLQHLYPQPAPLPPDEQAQAIARVRERLLQAETSLWETPDGDAEVAIIDLPPQAPAPFRAKPRRGRQVVRLLNTLAAVIVVGAIITTSVLLFAHRSPVPPAASPVNPIGVVVHTQANQLAASMSLTPGPYFLGELIEANISLTNNSHTTYVIQGVPAVNPCEQALGVSTTGGGAPHVPPPPLGFFSCHMILTQFHPGQTITVHQYIALTDSGTITLTVGARFIKLKTVDAQGDKTVNNASDPLQGHWPSQSINVNPHVPANRKLSFQFQGPYVVVNGPSQALSPHLLYLYNVTCGNTATVNGFWQPLPGNEVIKPGCNKFRWDFAFASVGYTFIMGHDSA